MMEDHKKVITGLNNQMENIMYFKINQMLDMDIQNHNCSHMQMFEELISHYRQMTGKSGDEFAAKLNMVRNMSISGRKLG